jgi:hypothetical protein
MNPIIGTIIILAVVAAVAALALRSVIKSRKSGGSCGCGCSECGMTDGCKPSEQ